MSTARMTVASPYKGLASFEESDLDALLFFGRERERQIVTANLLASRLTVLYGVTGVGKSSLLRAGVAHAFRREPGVDVVVFDEWSGDPGRAILAAAGVDGATLAAGLAVAAERAGGDLCLVLDQFEQFFLYHHDELRPGTFAYELAEAVNDPALRVNFLLGVREDALAQLDVFKPALPGLFANSLRLDRLDRTAGRAAIVGPVDAYNGLVDEPERVEVEPELVEAVLDEVTVGRVHLSGTARGGADGDDAAAGRVEAPYLQLVMERLWSVERGRASNRLRLATLRELGGAVEIVEEHLERAMAELTPEQKDAAAEMYNHLVTPSGAKIGHEVRDLARYAHVEEDAAAGVLQRLAHERIVRATSENGAAATRYEIFHDVLADAVLAWRTRYEAERALAEAERGRRRAHRVAAIALVALALVAALALFALLQRSSARTQARHARARELAADAAGELGEDPQTSLGLALRAARLEPTEQVEDLVRDALRASRLRSTITAPRPVLAVGSGVAGSVALAGDATGRLRALDRRGNWRRVGRLPAAVTAIALGAGWSAVGAADGSIRLRSLGSGTPRLLRQPGEVTALAAARRGRVVATGSADGTIRLWRLPATRPRRVRVPGRVTSLAFSPDAQQLLVVSVDRAARVVDVRRARVAHVLRHDGFVFAAAFSPDGRRIATGGYLHTTKLWSAATGRRVRVLDDAANPVTALAFSKDGKLLLTASADDIGRVYDAATGVRLFFLIGHMHSLTSVAVNGDASYGLTGSTDGVARLWKLDIGRSGFVLSGHRDSITAAGFAANARWVVTAGADDTIRLWDPDIQPDLRVVARQRDPLWSVAVSRDGSHVATGDVRGLVRVRVSGGRRVVRTLQVPRPVRAVEFGPRGVVAVGGPERSLAFSRDGSTRAIGADDGRVTVVRTADGRLVRRFRAGSTAVTGVALSSDGRLLATGSKDGSVRLWRLPAGTLLRRLGAHPLPVTAVAFSPDDELVASAGRDSTVRLWHVRGGERDVLRPHGGVIFDVRFSADGRWIVTAGPTTVGVTSVRTQKTFLLLSGHQPVVRGAAFAPDSRTIFTVGDDGTLRTYRCELCAPLPTLVRLGERQLTRAEPSPASAPAARSTSR